MEENTFEAVIEVEKEIQSMVGRERERIDAWLAEARDGVDREMAQKREQLKVSLAEEREAAQRSAEERAAQLLRETKIRIDHLERLDDSCLKRIVWRHMTALVPEI
ncbi:MAG: hypothetical protein R3231_06980 [bacterium]|nr:hypothetical protein [bacterium]